MGYDHTKIGTMASWEWATDWSTDCLEKEQLQSPEISIVDLGCRIFCLFSFLNLIFSLIVFMLRNSPASVEGEERSGCNT